MALFSLFFFESKHRETQKFLRTISKLFFFFYLLGLELTRTVTKFMGLPGSSPGLPRPQFSSGLRGMVRICATV